MSDEPTFAEYVFTWTGIFISAWIVSGFIYLITDFVLAVIGLQRSAVMAACLGALVGVIAWAANKLDKARAV